MNEAVLICHSIDSGFPVYIYTENTNDEAYTLKIEPKCIEIISKGANGAFYALQTLKLILKENADSVQCQVINDFPDMKYRGFYHDVTRGKVPTLKTLKELVDTLAVFKMNSLQLYIEHTFEFKEYEFCREELGCLTRKEIAELDAYCKSKFVELIPSISTFGHLYHLLSSDNYRHLSEFPDYVPTKHYWIERMNHHTINPELKESFLLVKGLIDQYIEVTTSNKFNICCDETFDLGRGVNQGKDKTKLYVNFVKKIIGYLNSKGKTVMMWGDIVLKHPDCIKELPDDVIFLNWSYADKPSEDQFKRIYESGRNQIVCSGTSSWNSFAEDIIVEEGNITTLTKYAYKYNSIGLLNTNWGDFGNIASITMSAYGLILGAALSWNKETISDSNFRKEASMAAYGNIEIIDILSEISDIRKYLSWYKVINGKAGEVQDGYIEKPTLEEYKKILGKLKFMMEKASVLLYTSDTIKREVLNAIGGFEVMTFLCSKVDGYAINFDFDCNSWLEEFSELWTMKNKISELNEVRRILEDRLRL